MRATGRYQGLCTCGNVVRLTLKAEIRHDTRLPSQVAVLCRNHPGPGDGGMVPVTAVRVPEFR